MSPENAVKLFFSKTLTSKPDMLLLAISGGVDSMVLAHILLKLKIPFAAAHCNYQLRGEESLLDERMVASFCRKNNIRLHAKKFNTLAYCKKHKVGIQEGARNLRYAYFKDICTLYHYPFICTAHHKNDFVETYLFNLLRGSGIKGLRGILPQRDNLIRPMLDADKQEIYLYAKKHHIPFRNDQSNYKNNYSRNYIRNEIVPELLLIHPDLIEDIYQSGKDMQVLQQYNMQQLALFEHTFITHDENGSQININNWLGMQGGAAYFKLYLIKLGFNKDAINKILNAKSGSKFLSAEYILERYDTKAVVVKKESVLPIVEQQIGEHTNSFMAGNRQFQMSFTKSSITTYRPGHLYLDADLLHYPLLLRKWEPGDKFIPFGMTAFKKVSDFLTDLKLPAHIKNNTCVLVSDQTIVAVLPYRTDNRFRLGVQSSRALCIYPA